MERTVKTRYIPQLDAIRAIAVLMVIYQHAYFGNTPDSFLITKLTGDMFTRKPLLLWSQMGVDLFLVLSGFLITGILLCQKDTIGAENTTLHAARQFYIRRILRICPIYFLTVIMAALFNVGTVRETLVWNLTYTTNIAIALKGGMYGVITHLWSLAVEEQFYLVWPWIILMVPKQHLLKLICIIILIGPFYRLFAMIVDLNWMARRVITLSVLDLLGMGSLLAILRHNGYRYGQLIRCFKYVGIILLITLLVMNILDVCALELHNVNNNISNVCKNLFIVSESMVFVWLINATVDRSKVRCGAILENRLLIYIGKISYGLYLYHYFIIFILKNMRDNNQLYYIKNDSLFFIIVLIISMVVSSLSWVLIEGPIKKIKQKYSY